MPAMKTCSSVKFMLEHGQTGDVVLVSTMMASTWLWDKGYLWVQLNRYVQFGVSTSASDMLHVGCHYKYKGNKSVLGQEHMSQS